MSTDSGLLVRLAFPVIETGAHPGSAAYSAGHAEGYAAGLEAAQREERRRLEREAAIREADRADDRAALERTLAAMRAAADRLDRREAPVLADAGATLMAAAVELAEAVLGAELAAGSHARAALDRALAAGVGRGSCTVSLHPLDAAVLDAAALDGVPLPDGVRIAADASLAPGDAVASYADGSVDARIAQALQRARDELAAATRVSGASGGGAR